MKYFPLNKNPIPIIQLILNLLYVVYCIRAPEDILFYVGIILYIYT